MTDELQVLLAMLGRQRFVISGFLGDHHGPEVLAAVHDWAGAADVLIMRGATEAHAYRALTGNGSDLFAPAQVLWVYHSSAVWTLRAVLTLPPPGHHQAPRELIEAPPGLGVPIEARRPVRVRIRER